MMEPGPPPHPAISLGPAGSPQPRHVGRRSGRKRGGSCKDAGGDGRTDQEMGVGSESASYGSTGAAVGAALPHHKLPEGEEQRDGQRRSHSSPPFPREPGDPPPQPNLLKCASLSAEARERDSVTCRVRARARAGLVVGSALAPQFPRFGVTEVNLPNDSAKGEGRGHTQSQRLSAGGGRGGGARQGGHEECGGRAGPGRDRREVRTVPTAAGACHLWTPHLQPRCLGVGPRIPRSPPPPPPTDPPIVCAQPPEIILIMLPFRSLPTALTRALSQVDSSPAEKQGCSVPSPAGYRQRPSQGLAPGATCARISHSPLPPLHRMSTLWPRKR
ncbi:uncharacterized protein [Notamacropus eugenii]|uniref:uncharacterized protein n=1 Tax=Notamacropus eugenii TaxID=9315 RepID=UPI003B67E66D